MTRSQKQRKQYDRLAVLDYIEQYQRRYPRRSPSQRHISRALAMSSPSRANYAVHQLRADGLLEIQLIEPGLPADLHLTSDGKAQLERWRARQQVLRQSRQGTA